MFGLIGAIISGISMSLQGVFNTRLSEKIGTWETNTFVQATGLILSLIILFFFKDGTFKEIKSTNKLYLLGGVLGVIITFKYEIIRCNRRNSCYSSSSNIRICLNWCLWTIWHRKSSIFISWDTWNSHNDSWNCII